MTTNIYLDRRRIRSESRSHSSLRSTRGLEAFVVYGLLPAALVIAYLVYVTVETH